VNLLSSVEVVSYNPEWKEWFNALRASIWPHVSEHAVDIIHVGSTSIPGMSAKPIIDLSIIVETFDDFDKIKEGLAEMGYIHQGDLGIKEREAFKLDEEPMYPHHLYVCLVDSVPYRNHILLKKHLTENPEAFNRYKELKIGLAETSESREAYWRAKTELILEFLEAERMSSSEITRIRSENLGKTSNFVEYYS
jgi:GrpB-like predicted nucleotidyltransferase (UPF0157 family)